jgi:hypothetical protein
MKMGNNDLREQATENIKKVFENNLFFTRMSKKQKSHIFSCISDIAQNAYRIGYFGRAFEIENKVLTIEDFDFLKQNFSHQMSSQLLEIERKYVRYKK